MSAFLNPFGGASKPAWGFGVWEDPEHSRIRRWIAAPCPVQAPPSLPPPAQTRTAKPVTCSASSFLSPDIPVQNPSPPWVSQTLWCPHRQRRAGVGPLPKLWRPTLAERDDRAGPGVPCICVRCGPDDISCRVRRNEVKGELFSQSGLDPPVVE